MSIVFVELDDAYRQQHHAPEKESGYCIVCGKTGRVYGLHVHSYNHERNSLHTTKMQEDKKELTFDAIDTVKGVWHYLPAWCLPWNSVRML